MLERKGERCALLVTKGFKDLLLIGDQTRPDLFDLHIKRPGVLYEKVVEVEERVTIESRVDIPEDAEVSPEGDAYVTGLSGNKVRVVQPLGKLSSLTRSRVIDRRCRKRHEAAGRPVRRWLSVNRRLPPSLLHLPGARAAGRGGSSEDRLHAGQRVEPASADECVSRL